MPLLAALALAAAGCGEKEEPSLDDIPPPTPTAAADAPGRSAGEAKSALRDAAAAMEEFFTDRQRYTDQRGALGPGFPASVQIEQASATGYRLSATAGQLRLTLARDGRGRMTRECAPPDPEVCPGGEW